MEIFSATPPPHFCSQLLRNFGSSYISLHININKHNNTGIVLFCLFIFPLDGIGCD